MYEGEELFPTGFTQQHRPLYSEAPSNPSNAQAVLLGIKRQPARFIAAAALPSPSKVKGTSALAADEMLERLAGRTKGGPGRPGKNARDAMGVAGMDVFASEECIVDITLVGTSQKARRAEDLRHSGWVSHYRRDLSFIDISDGVVRNEPLYLLYQRGSERPPITAIRVVHPKRAASPHTESDFRDHSSQLDNGWQAVGISLPDFLLANEGEAAASGSIGLELQVRRDVGAPPITAIDFIFAESEAVPNGYALLDHRFGRAQRSHLFGKKRDLRLVYKIGDVPRGSIELQQNQPIDDHQQLPREALDHGLAVLAPMADGSEAGTPNAHITVQTNVPIPRWARPKITIVPDLEEHAKGFVFTCSMINETAFTVQTTRANWVTSGDMPIKISWEITGQARLTRAQRRQDDDTVQSRRSFEVLEQLRAATFRVPELAFEVDGWLPVSHVAVQHEGVKYLVLTPRIPSDTSRKVRVAVGVQVVNDVRIITLSSPLIIHNNLDVTMELCYQQIMHDESVTVALERGGTFCLPLGVADMEQHQEEFKPLYRFYSKVQNCCFYTTDPLDIQDLGSTDWIQQSALGYVYARPFPNTAPLWVRQPMDFIDKSPGLTTNRFGYQKSGSVKTVSELKIAGYRVVGCVLPPPPHVPL